MKLITRCTSCKKDIKIKSLASTRPELEMEKGAEFKVNCKNCGTSVLIHVNDVKAESNNGMIGIGIAIGIISAVILWAMFGAIGIVSAIIPIFFWRQQMNSTKAFNSYLVRRK